MPYVELLYGCTKIPEEALPLIEGMEFQLVENYDDFFAYTPEGDRLRADFEKILVRNYGSDCPLLRKPTDPP